MPSQTLLLRAALLPVVQALPAWQTWCMQTDIEHTHPDFGSFRLLPLVWRNLHEAVPDAPLMGRLRGIHRHTWAANQARIAAIDKVLRDLVGAGIEALLLEDGAMLAAYYGDPGLRALNEGVVLVHPEQARLALQTLIQAGWQMGKFCPASLPEEYSEFVHAGALTNAAGQRIRVQWRLIAHDRRGHADDEVWATARSGELGECPARVPAPEALLFGLVDALASSVPARVLPGLADLWMLLRDQDSDGAHLAEVAHTRRIDCLLRLAFEFLSGLADETPVPPAALSALAALPPSPTERAICTALSRPATRWNRWMLHWQRFRLGQESAVAAALRFPRYLQYTLGEPNFLSVGRHVLRRRQV
jgi:hypothetical protein